MKKAKVDAIIKRKVTEARKSGVIEGRKQEREKYELEILPPDDGIGVCIIGGEPAPHRLVYVAIYPGRHTRLMRDRGDMDFRESNMGMQRAAFRAVQMCQSFQTGQRVVWYNYQFEGLR